MGARLILLTHFANNANVLSRSVRTVEFHFFYAPPGISRVCGQLLSRVSVQRKQRTQRNNSRRFYPCVLAVASHASVASKSTQELAACVALRTLCALLGWLSKV